MADVAGAARASQQADVPLDGAPLGLGADAPVSMGRRVLPVVDISPAQEGVVLAVRGDGPAEPSCLQHGLAHQLRRLYTVPVVRKSADIGSHGRHVREFGALLPARDGPVGQYVDGGVARYKVQPLRKRRRVFRHGREVRHGADGGIARARRGLGA